MFKILNVCCLTILIVLFSACGETEKPNKKTKKPAKKEVKSSKPASKTAKKEVAEIKEKSMSPEQIKKGRGNYR